MQPRTGWGPSPALRSRSLPKVLLHAEGAVPAVLLAAGLLADHPLLVALALIWFAHIGMDRLAGYGLTYPTDFKDTHLGRV